MSRVNYHYSVHIEIMSYTDVMNQPQPSYVGRFGSVDLRTSISMMLVRSDQRARIQPMTQ